MKGRDKLLVELFTLVLFCLQLRQALAILAPERLLGPGMPLADG
jgi:hypothetical protein